MGTKAGRSVITLMTSAALAVNEITPGHEAKEPHVHQEQQEEPRAVGLQCDPVVRTSADQAWGNVFIRVM